MMVSLSLVASTLGLLIASRPQERAGSHRDHRARLDGRLGPLGRLVPARDHRGRRYQFVGHLLPTSWILDGCAAFVVRGFDVADVLPAFGFSVAWAAGLFVLAVWRFRLSD